MELQVGWFRIVVLMSAISQLHSLMVLSDESQKCSNLWAVEVNGGSSLAKHLAAKHGFEYVAKLFSDFYLYQRLMPTGDAKVTVSCFNSSLHKALKMEPDIIWFEQQVPRKYNLYTTALTDNQFNDPKWEDQWYINGKHEPSHNVTAVWDQQITGKGVVIAVVDDGVDQNHPELKNNFDQSASYDVLGMDNDPSPSGNDYHGSQCAGVIAALANNSLCGIGIAFNSRIGGIRLVSGYPTDAEEALALSFNRSYIDIYSNSWGPGMLGKVQGPKNLTSKALEDGSKLGRKGRGSIFVFAAGNGGIVDDSCAFNGYVNSIYTIAISGANRNGSLPNYAERCPGIMAVTYSGQYGDSDDVVTVHKNGQCSSNFSRSSAAAAMASGMIALLLQSNETLSWRDVQHIIVRSARADKSALKSGDWKSNGAGLLVSNYYGFGLMDAFKMVEYGRKWKKVADQLKCEMIQQKKETWEISASEPLKVSLVLKNLSSSCGSGSEIRFLEHVQVRLNLTFSKRGDLLVDLQSPSGTVSQLIQQRPMDSLFQRSNALNGWTITTLHHWSERPLGTWSLTLRNYDPKTDNKGTLFSWALILYGTNTDPLRENSYVPTPPVQPSVSTGSTVKTSVTSPPADRSLGPGPIAGIAIATIAVCAAGVGLLAYKFKRKFKG